jgi:hypothetical protein
MWPNHFATKSQYVRFETAATCSRWFLARGFFYPEDGGDMLLRNVGSHKIYTSPHPRRLDGGIRFPARARNVSLLHSVHTGSEVHPASYPMRTDGSFQRVKQPKHGPHRSLPSSAQVKNMELYVHFPIKHRDDFANCWSTFCAVVMLKRLHKT